MSVSFSRTTFDDEHRVVRAIRAQLGIGSLSSGASFRNRYEVVLVVSSPVKKDANVIERIGCCISERRQGKFYAVEIGSATIGYFGKVFILSAQYGSERSKDQKIVFQILIRSALPERVAMGPVV